MLPWNLKLLPRSLITTFSGLWNVGLWLLRMLCNFLPIDLCLHQVLEARAVERTQGAASDNCYSGRTHSGIPQRLCIRNRIWKETIYPHLPMYASAPSPHSSISRQLNVFPMGCCMGAQKWSFLLIMTLSCHPVLPLLPLKHPDYTPILCPLFPESYSHCLKTI